MSFGEESTRSDQPNFPPQRFLKKAILTARMSRHRLTKWWVALKMDQNKFLTWFFVRQHPPAKKSMSPFRFISLFSDETLHAYKYWRKLDNQCTWCSSARSMPFAAIWENYRPGTSYWSPVPKGSIEFEHGDELIQYFTPPPHWSPNLPILIIFLLV
jgi:hypothetical protein